MAHVVLVGALASGALVHTLAIFILVVLACDALVGSLQSYELVVSRVKLHTSAFQVRGTHRSVAAVEALAVTELAVGVLISVLVGGTRLDADVVVGEVLAGEAVSWSLKHAAARETISNGDLLDSAIYIENMPAFNETCRSHKALEKITCNSWFHLYIPGKKLTGTCTCTLQLRWYIYSVIYSITYSIWPIFFKERVR